MYFIVIFFTIAGVAAAGNQCFCEKNFTLLCTEGADLVSVRLSPCSKQDRWLVYAGQQCFAYGLRVCIKFFKINKQF